MALSPSDARALLTGLIGMGGGVAAASLATGVDKKKTTQVADRKQFRQTVNSVITGFDTQALKQLRNMLRGIMPQTKDQINEKEPKQPSWWRKLLGPALMVLGGLASLIAGFLTDGQFKGLMKLIGKGGLLGGLKIAFKMFQSKFSKFFKTFKKFFVETVPDFLKKMFKPVASLFKGGLKGGFLAKAFQFIVKYGGKAAKFFKPIPIIGGLISFAFAYSRFKSGDIAGGLLEILSGVASFFPGIGTAISIGIDILLAVLDYKSGGTPAAGGKAKGGILKEWALQLAEWLLRLPPFLPAYMFYKGIKTIASGGSVIDALIDMAYTLPFFGTLAGWLGAPASAEEAKEDIGNKDGFFHTVKNYLMGSFPFKNIVQFGTGIGKLVKGNIIEGLTDMSYAVPFFGSLVSFFGGPATAQQAQAVLPSSKAVFARIGSSIFKKVKSWWKSAPRWLKWAGKRVIPESILAKLDAKDDPEDDLGVAEAEGSINRGSSSISAAGKKIEVASAKFGKSSPGVWEYIAKASNVLIGNVKKIIGALGFLFKGVLNALSPITGLSGPAGQADSAVNIKADRPLNTRSDQQDVLIDLQNKAMEVSTGVLDALGEEGAICKRLDAINASILASGSSGSYNPGSSSGTTNQRNNWLP